MGWLKRLFTRRFKPAEPVPCPYCPNPDRDSVFDNWKGCLYDAEEAARKGIIGADPPCICDDYGTKPQRANLGVV